jgi:hypothetical protein
MSWQVIVGERLYSQRLINRNKKKFDGAIEIINELNSSLLCGGKVERSLVSFYSGDPDMIMSCLACSKQSVWLRNASNITGRLNCLTPCRQYFSSHSWSVGIGIKTNAAGMDSIIRHLSLIPEHSGNRGFQ